MAIRKDNIFKKKDNNMFEQFSARTRKSVEASANELHRLQMTESPKGFAGGTRDMSRLRKF